jgi:hypothetical protein
MKAAESAAIADGVVATKTALHDNLKAQNPSNTSTTTTTTTTATHPAIAQDPKVAAAYAMVAAVNGATNVRNATVRTTAATPPISNSYPTPASTPVARNAMLAKTGMTLSRTNNQIVGNPVLGASAALKPTPAPVTSNYSSGPTSAGSAAHMLATNPPPPSATPQAAPSNIPKPNTRPHSSSGRSTASVSSTASSKKKGPPLRRGKWTAEEESYANRLIQEFKAGLLPLTDGTTLRTFLSKLLNCDPMRISKKFVGNNCIGKQVFRRRTNDIKLLTPEQIQQSRAELSE